MQIEYITPQFNYIKLMNKILKYDFALPDEISTIVEADFWVLKNYNAKIFSSKSNPVKFTSNVSILIRKGKCNIDINLISYAVKAPCIVNIRRTQILQINRVSDDLEFSVIIMSKRFCDNLFLLLQDCIYYPSAVRQQVTEIPDSLLNKFECLYSRINSIFEDKANPFGYQAMSLCLASFFFETAYKCYMQLANDFQKGNNRLTSKFISLVQKHFKTERFLEFYANKLEVYTKHLSRTMKNVTGFTAVEWIERYVILEAKVLLKSSNLNVKQISEELNFPSQSFFGKYFKKIVGISPKDFRSS